MTTKTLATAQGGECFWINNGPVVKDLFELKEALAVMSADTFRYHARGVQNDFIVWIKEVLRADDLASKLGRVKTRRGYIGAIKRYIA